MDWTALFGVLGTLGGTVVGWLVSWKTQIAQQQFEERTAFHQERVGIYVDFVRIIELMIKDLENENLKKTRTEYKEFDLIYKKIELLAAEQVKSQALKIVQTIASAMTGPTGQKTIKEEIDTEELTNQLNDDLKRFLENARLELGVNRLQNLP